MCKQQMNSRELVFKTIQHEFVHKVPKGELILDDNIIRDSLRSKSIGFHERLEFVKQFNLDIISLSPKYSKTDFFSIDCTELDIEKWTQNTSLFTFVILDGAFEYGLRLIGFSEFFTMIMKNPEGSKSFISKVENLNLETASKLADCGVDGVIIADDIAFQDGLMIRPNLFRELFLPSLEKQVKAIEKTGMIPFFHSDGNYLDIIIDIINAGFKGIHCIDKQCGVDLNALQPYSDKLCLWGHLDKDDLESSQDTTKMKQLIQNIKTTTDFKGFILGTNSGLFSGININELKHIHKSLDDWMYKLN